MTAPKRPLYDITTWLFEAFSGMHAFALAPLGSHKHFGGVGLDTRGLDFGRSPILTAWFTHIVLLATPIYYLDRHLERSYTTG